MVYFSNVVISEKKTMCEFILSENCPFSIIQNYVVPVETYQCLQFNRCLASLIKVCMSSHEGLQKNLKLFLYHSHMFSSITTSPSLFFTLSQHWLPTSIKQNLHLPQFACKILQPLYISQQRFNSQAQHRVPIL